MTINAPEMTGLQVSNFQRHAFYMCASLVLYRIRMRTLAGVLAAQPLSAAAISVPQCEQLTTAGNGIQFCDTKEGTGKTPAKGALIRCLLACIVCVLAVHMLAPGTVD